MKQIQEGLGEIVHDIQKQKIKDISQLNPGLYSLHLFVEETRNLISDDSEASLSPLIKATTFQQEQISAKKNEQGLGQVYWGYHCFFSKKFDDPQQLKTECLKIQILNSKILGDQLVGEIDIDLLSIYMNENNAFIHQWHILNNPNKNFEQSMGYIKISVQMYTKDDKQIVLEREKIKPKINNSLNGEKSLEVGEPEIQLPPQIKRVSYQMVIKLARCMNLVKADIFDKIDAYLVFELGSIKLQTKVVESTYNPVFNDTFFIPYTEPNVNMNLSMKLYDYDAGRIDELIGSNYFDKKKITNGDYSQFTWVNIYGSQMNLLETISVSDISKVQNSQSTMGVYWKGRVLLSITSKQVEDPKANIDRMTQKEIDQAKSMSDQINFQKYKIQVDLLYGIQFSDKDSSYKVMVRWADQEVLFNSKKIDQGLYKWYEKQDKDIEFPIKDKKDGNEIPDIFVYLIKGDVKISYKRFKYSDLIASDNYLAAPQLISLNPDKAVKDTRLDLAGYLKIKILVGKQEMFSTIKYQRANQFPKDFNVNQKQSIGALKKGILIANVYQAQNLVPADDNGKSDPYFEISYFGKSKKSDPIDDSLNPIFNKIVVIEEVPYVNPQDIKKSDPIIIKLYDSDQIIQNKVLNTNLFNSDDFMGWAKVDFTDLYDEKKEAHQQSIQFDQIDTNLITPKWVQLKYGKIDCGKILVSFHMLSEDSIRSQRQLTKELQQIRTNNNQIRYPTKEYLIRIKMLGLRDLQSSGLFPVQNAYIVFDTNSVQDVQNRNKDKNAQKIETIPKDKGPNPNLLSVMKIKVFLPQQEKYFNNLSCTVYDKTFFMIKQTIGTFSIDLQKHYKLTQQKFNAQLMSIYDKMKKDHTLFQELKNKLKFDPAKMVMEKQKFNLRSLVNPIQRQNDNVENKSRIFDDSKVSNVQVFNNIFDQDNRSRVSKNVPRNFNEVFDISSRLPQKELHSNANQGELNQMIEMQRQNEKAKENEDALQQVQRIGEVVNNELLLRFAKYEYDEKTKQIKEVDIPDADKFLGLSWDSVELKLSKQKRKHYRYILDQALEKTKFIDENTFESFEIYKDCKDIVDDYEDFQQKSESLGVFKGHVEVFEKEQSQIIEAYHTIKKEKSKERRKKKGRLIRQPSGVEVEIPKYDNLDIENDFMIKKKVIIRVYVLKIDNLAHVDSDSASDPYIKIRLGDNVIDDQENYQRDQTKVGIYKMYQLVTTLPGESQLNVQVYDYNHFLSDTLIGETIVDLELRFYSERWRNLQYKPIEKRSLTTKTCEMSKGQITMFLEIIEEQNSNLVKEVWQVSPKPPQEFQLRLVIWDIEGCPNLDDEDVSDFFVTVQLGDEKQQTDVHYRAQDGSGSFNWRMLFNVMLPNEDLNLQIAVWDKDILSPNDFTCSTTFDMQEIAEQAFENDKSIKLRDNQDDGIISKAMSLTQKSKSGGQPMKFTKSLQRQDPDTNKIVDTGKVTFTMELLPKIQAESNPVGVGRDKPNHSPFCPEPINRFEFSFNPYTLFTRLVGPKARRKVCMICCCALCITLIVISIPTLFSEILVKMLV